MEIGIEEFIAALRVAHEQAIATGAVVYLNRITGPGSAPDYVGPARYVTSPIVWADDMQLRISPAGHVQPICDICGAGLSPLEGSAI